MRSEAWLAQLKVFICFHICFTKAPGRRKLLLRNLIASSKKHRDGNNDGPSGIESFGPQNGGELLYWVGDGGGALSDLVDEPQVIDARRLTEILQMRDALQHSVVQYGLASPVDASSKGPAASIVFLELIRVCVLKVTLILALFTKS